MATLLALRAVECDPLRESANVLVVRARLSAGDLTGAIRHSRRYAEQLRDELGVSPPAELNELLSRVYRERSCNTPPDTVRSQPHQAAHIGRV